MVKAALCLQTALWATMTLQLATAFQPTPLLTAAARLTRSSSLGLEVAQSRSRGEVSMLNSVFGKPKPKTPPAPPAKPDIIPPDYKLPAAFFVGGVGLCLNENLGAGIPMALIGAFLASRAQKVRFVFDKEALEVMTVDKEGQLDTSGENFAVGGRNRWTYDSFVDWKFLPNPALPILVYFKETQTRPEGQIHFFPIIMDGPQLYKIMKERIPLP